MMRKMALSGLVMVCFWGIIVGGDIGAAAAAQPKPLSEQVSRGLEWLIQHQQNDGGWAQGEESQQMGNALEKLKDISDVADTAMALTALLRSGSTPKDGPYAEHIRRGLDFICREVEASDEQSLFITSIQGTRVQMKIGTYIDTFLAANVLTDVKDQMPDADGTQRIIAALDKVMDKIESNQRADGTWDNQGWATTLAQSTATKALNKAAQRGYVVDERVREKAETYARNQYDKKSGNFKVAAESAGVELYASGSALNSMQESVLTNEVKTEELERKVKDAKTDKERQDAEQTLSRFEDAKRDLADARKDVIKRLDDQQFIAGFGSNGGEEFLSYLNIGESLFIAGGKDWEDWDKKITENLNRIQNNDGSWAGQHCITGRTFCTSAALLVLMLDRSPANITHQ